MMKRYIIGICVCLAITLASAQTRREMGGIYHAYPKVDVKEMRQTPSGYKPFYISHYGRHGSRWMTSDERYIKVAQYFDDESNLTPTGLKVKKLIIKARDNAMGHGGKLSKLGELQHKGIADRMYRNFPNIFAQGNRVQARSSVVDRCAKSMKAFIDELRHLQPSLAMDVKTDSADMAWIAYASPEVKALEKQTKVVAKVNTDRFMRQLFKDISKIDNPLNLMSEIHSIASSMQDVGLNFKRYPKDIENGLYALFTDEEFRAFYDANNLRMTICNGIYPTNEDIPARSAISLWQNITTKADEALSYKTPSADLRFGHDTSLYRLLSLLSFVKPNYGLISEVPNGEIVTVNNVDLMDRVVPMAANLQMVFYKSTFDSPKDSVVVKFFLNGKPMVLPLSSTDTDGNDAACYNWNLVKEYVANRIHKLGHIRQLNALNTMVGTAQANTHTAGLFGKGSEEHGQTLPAVLVPNGQNFWTPQTQDTEKKCIAPYYYKDTMLQGFRNSHWIVGGCTQDYGSFTIATIGGKLRLQPEERATKFSHADEVSHPHYYSVLLRDENLKSELTALSHTAILRVTPTADELVHIVINPNSDEMQSGIEVDTINHIVYGYNPVHRIYQGWGESAGFSGHLVLKYTDELVDYGVKDGIAWLTFRGKMDVPMEFATASSFTNKANALNNLVVETDSLQMGFYDMMLRCQDEWLKRLHTIDVADSDTAKINQFYGAMYRASFLPREMSDCNGDYPEFSTGITKHIDSSLLSLHSSLKKYGDFSMWDIYRAQLPLYNIVAPTLSGRMMQSLVDMYQEGGWLPIFPCWNSYTAAMIGDHCSVALADAYAKGVRNFDADKAYEAMRKNAFETPKSFAEYKNGMGRRALESYLKYAYIPLEDSVKEAFHTCEQTSRTLEYAFDDFAVAQMAKMLGHDDDYNKLMAPSQNWKNVINPKTGWADGRYANGKWLGCEDLVSRQSFITEGSICHYSWYVPHDVDALVERMGGKAEFEHRLDMMFALNDSSSAARLLYWHGNEPCHQIPFLYSYIGKPEKTKRVVDNILKTEYNDTPGGLSGNDDAGQMSAWYMFAAMGFYPVCPSIPYYIIGSPSFDRVTFNLENKKQFEIICQKSINNSNFVRLILNGKQLDNYQLSHGDIINGGKLIVEE